MTDRDLTAIATFFVASALVVYFAVLVQVCISILRDPSTGGLKKAAWLSLLLLVPVLAPMLFVATRRRKPAQRAGEGLAQSEVLIHIRPAQPVRGAGDAA